MIGNDRHRDKATKVKKNYYLEYYQSNNTKNFLTIIKMP